MPEPACLEPHLDGCPSCVINGEVPVAHIEHATYCIATYTCADCGHEWTTTWRTR